MNNAPSIAESRIGIFDSGVGGLSVLRHVRNQLPNEHLVYFADSWFAPYGEKPEVLVASRAIAIGDFLVDKGAKALVIACNTATASAIHLLRARYPGMPIVGVEPGLKPASIATRAGIVGVLATERTLSSDKFRRLQDRIKNETGARFSLQSCAGLADLIETGKFDSDDMTVMLERYINPLLDQGADTLVLGCTHYPLVRSAIEKVVQRHGRREVALIDTGPAVARHLGQLLAEAGKLRAPGAVPPRLRAYTSASSAALAAAFSDLLDIRDVEIMESGSLS